MYDDTITVSEAIEQVEKWLAEANRQCTLHSGGSVGDVYYTIFLSRWHALKEVAELLSKIETREEF